jgi:DNA segregation ATPase FtsK/SpoIIIE-like protein
LPRQEEIELPENAWEEDLSEWYVTATQNPMASSRQKLSALPPTPLKSTLNIKRPVVSEPEVGSVASHLLGAEFTSEVSSEEVEVSQYDLPKPVAPIAKRDTVKNTNVVDRDPHTGSIHTEEPNRPQVQSPMGHAFKTEAPKVFQQSVEAEPSASKKPTSVSQLAEQIEDLKSQARQQAQEVQSSSNIQLPEHEITPAMAMSVAEMDFDEDSYESFEESTPARAMVNPGNIATGGEGEVRELTNPYADFVLPSLDMLDYHEKDVAKYDEDELMELADTLVDKLADFKVHGEVETICPGPVITTFEFKPARGVRVSKIATLADDIAMALRAVSV